MVPELWLHLFIIPPGWIDDDDGDDGKSFLKKKLMISYPLKNDSEYWQAYHCIIVIATLSRYTLYITDGLMMMMRGRWSMIPMITMMILMISFVSFGNHDEVET